MERRRRGDEEEALKLVTMQKGTNFPAGRSGAIEHRYFLLSAVVSGVSARRSRYSARSGFFEPLDEGHVDLRRTIRRSSPGTRRDTPAADGGGFKVEASNAR